jgi:protein-S-isoprenylcysteine O-methyltransferase Ste14
MTPILMAVLFLLVHVAAPWGLSLLSTRHGWADGRPGPLNLLALSLVAAGIAGTLWLMALHFHASPGSFLELRPGQKLLTPGPYGVSRNPMYLFELAFWFGWALFYGSVAVFIGFLLWWVIFNYIAIPYEERGLEARFGEARPTVPTKHACRGGLGYPDAEAGEQPQRKELRSGPQNYWRRSLTS